MATKTEATAPKRTGRAKGPQGPRTNTESFVISANDGTPLYRENLTVTRLPKNFSLDQGLTEISKGNAVVTVSWQADNSKYGAEVAGETA